MSLNNSYLKTINSTIESMKHILEYADIKYNHLLLTDDNIKDLDMDFILSGNDWILNIYTNQYAVAADIWHLLRPEDWNRYKKFDWETSFREVELLENAIKDLKKVLRKKHPLFLKGKRDERARQNRKITRISKHLEKEIKGE